MALGIIVCVKTIIQLNNCDLENRTLTNIRKGLSGTINSVDIKAIMQAVEIKSRNKDACITVISMGPISTKETLQSLYAYGVDQVILLSDPVFSGADTLATSSVLASAIKKIGAFDIVFCGWASEDGGTGQVGPEIAEILGIPHATDVQNCKWKSHSVICERILCMRKLTIEMEYPCLVVVNEHGKLPVPPTLQAMVDSMHRETLVWNHTDIGIAIDKCGKKGSATRVNKLCFDRTLKTRGQIVQGEAKDLANSFLNFIRDIKEKQDSGRVSMSTQTIADSMYQPSSYRNMGTNPRTVWVYIEHNGNDVFDGIDCLLEKGMKLSKQMEGSLTAILVGYRLTKIIEYVKKYRVDKILVVDHKTLETGGEQELAEALVFLMDKEMPQVILFGATTHGRSLAPRLAAKLHTGLTADCLDITLENFERIVMIRPAFSGRILAEIVNETFPVIATLRLQKVQSQQVSENFNCPIPTFRYEQTFHNASFRCISHEKTDYNPSFKDEFSIVVGVGAGIGNRDNLQLLDTLCSLLHADIKASREAVVRGLMESHTQIGISGQTIAPTIYVACGISGAVQHMLGVQESQYIIAINNNIEDPIFNYSSLGLLGDIKEVVTAILEILQTDSSVLVKGCE